MDYNVIQALQAITREKHLDQSIILESLVAGLQSAAKKKIGAEANIEASVDPDTGEMLVEQVKTVVEEVDDPDLEIGLEEAQIEFGDEVEVGDQVRWELPLDQFGRNAILVAKQILVQKVREAERMQIYDEYKDLVNTIIEGRVQQIDRGNALINLGRVEALLPYREQIRGEKLRQGGAVRAFIVEVLDSTKGPQIILSRSHPGFLKVLFAQEVPEIQEKIVEIKAVAREPGTRSKIAVISYDDRVDPVGSCVGMKGSRVQAVTRELAGERIDIVPWSGDPSLLISRALSPAEVSSISLDHERREATVVVAEDQLSKAIGKEGKNVRLAAKLTEWKIDLISSREHSIRQRVVQEVSMDLEEMSALTPEVARALRQAGIESIEELARVDVAALSGIPGIGSENASSLKETASATLDELKRMIEETVAAEMGKELGKDLFDDSVMSEDAESLEDIHETAAAIALEAAAEAAAANPFQGFDQKVEAKDGDDEQAAEAGDGESSERDA
jgi:N utilization substance protein A